MSNLIINSQDNIVLFQEISFLVKNARKRAIDSVNSELVLLNWHIGKLLKTEFIKFDRAEYGQEIVASLSQQLTLEFGKGFTKTALFRMVQFYEAFPEKEIVATLSRQLSWSHFVEFIPITDVLKRMFYAEMCRVEYWSIRVLRDKIQGMLYERTAISKKPDQLIKKELINLRKNNELTQNLILKDPYILEFLNLEDSYSEKDLELAILKELEKFLLELGGDFTFIARQKRIICGGEDFYIDLLFYHRVLKRLVALELKLGKFKAADKGQMEFYLRWLDKHERKEGENAPLGIILCAEKNNEQIELFELTDTSIYIAQYLTQLPSEEVLKNKLHQALERAKQQDKIQTP